MVQHGKRGQKSVLQLRRGFLLEGTGIRDNRERRRRNAEEVSKKQVSSKSLLQLESKRDNLLLIFEPEEVAPTTIAAPCFEMETTRDVESTEAHLLAEVNTTQHRCDNFNRIDKSRRNVEMERSQDRTIPHLPVETTSGSLPVDEQSRPSWLVEDKSSVGKPPARSSGIVSSNLRNELSRTLYRLRRKTDNMWHKIGSVFLSTFVSDSFECFFVWDSVVDSIIESQSSSSLATLRLGACLVDFSIEPCLSCIRSLGNGKTRHQVMACITVLEFSLSEWSHSFRTSTVCRLLDQVVPELRTMACSAQNKRTVLAQNALELALEIMTVASRISTMKDQTTDNQHRVLASLWGQMKCLDDLLDLQLLWTNGSLSTTTCSWEKARCQCKIALVSQWKHVNSDHRDVIDDAMETGATLENRLAWCRRLGGHQEYEIGDLFQTTTTRNLMEAESVVVCAARAADLSQNMSQENKDSSFSTECEVILCGIVAWLVQKGKRLKSSVGDQLLFALEANMLVLMKNGFASIASISFSGLHLLWSSFDTIPNDVGRTGRFGDVVELPKSMRALLDFLVAHANTDRTSVQHGLAIEVLIRCLQFGGKGLLHIFISEEDTDLSLDVLLQLLHSCGRSCEDKELCDAASMAVLSQFFSSPIVRNFVSSYCEVFTCAPTNAVIHQLVDLAVLSLEENNCDNLPILLDSILRTVTSSLDQDDSQTVKFLVQSMRAIGEENKIQKLGAAIGQRWRQTLFDEKQGLAELTFGRMLVAIGQEMIAIPSCKTTLDLFGYVAGDHFCVEEQGGFSALCVFDATNSVLRLCLTTMERNTDSDDIFQRLVPLLLLRRLPTTFFHIYSECLPQNERNNDERKELLADLSRRLSRYFDIQDRYSDSLCLSSKYSVDERRLAAEIAGRCLSLGGDKGDRSGLFEDICKPAFLQAISVLDTSCNTGNTGRMSLLRPAKAALFAVCYWISYAPGTDSAGRELLHVADFAYQVLRLAGDDKDNVLIESVLHLQTGCVQFFAQCFERRLLLSTSAHIEFKSKELGAENVNGTITISKAVSVLFDDAFRAAQGTLRKEDITTKVRVDLWNAFVLVAQRCPKSLLIPLRVQLLPELFEWDNEMDNQDKIPYLVVAASMQVAVVLLGRIKTQNCSWDDEEMCQGTTLRKSHRWAVRALKKTLKKEHDGVEPFVRHSLQSSAIKLLMATVVSTDETKEVGPEERLERLSILQRLTQQETLDEQTKMIASRLLHLLE